MLIYLVIINAIGFILFAVNTWLYNNTAEDQVDALLTLTALAGGSIGIVIAIFVIDRKAKKGNMMSRVFVFSILVIQIAAILFVKGYHKEQLTLDIWGYLTAHKPFLIYLGIINIIAFIVYGIDKKSAEGKIHSPRIRIVTLLCLAFIGGSIGAITAMYTFNHKTKKDYFSVGVPLIIIMQIIVLFYLMNAKFEILSRLSIS